MNNVESMLNAFQQIRRVYINEFTRLFKEETFSPNEIDILLFLSNNPSINTSIQLCVCLNVSKALVCRSVDALIKRHLLYAKADEKDKRIQRLYLSKEAKPVIEKIRELKNAINAELLSDISEEELRQMERTLTKIRTRFEMKVKGESQHESENVKRS